MNLKQDRQGVRTPADIERKYDLGQDYKDVIAIANNAQKSAERASTTANNARDVAEEAKRDVDELAEIVENMGGLDPSILDGYVKKSGDTMTNGAVFNFPSSTGQSAKVNHVGNGLTINCYQDKTNENNRSALKIEPEGDVLFFNKTVDGTTTWRRVLHEGNVGSYALPKAGGTLTGDVTIDKTATPVIYFKSASGQGRLTKNANDSVDYGTQLIDFDKDGNRVSFVIRGNYYNSPNVIARLLRISADGTVNNTYEIIHTGNISQHIPSGTAIAMTISQIRSICT